MIIRTEKGFHEAESVSLVNHYSSGAPLFIPTFYDSKGVAHNMVQIPITSKEGHILFDRLTRDMKVNGTNILDVKQFLSRDKLEFSLYAVVIENMVTFYASYFKWDDEIHSKISKMIKNSTATMYKLTPSYHDILVHPMDGLAKEGVLDTLEKHRKTILNCILDSSLYIRGEGISENFTLTLSV